MTIAELEKMKTENPAEFKRFCDLQIYHALRHKFFESEKAGKDLGEQALHDFVSKYAAVFREEYDSGIWNTDEFGNCPRDKRKKK